MAASPEQLLSLLAEIIRTAPRLANDDRLSEDDERWLSEAHAVLTATDDLHSLISFRSARSHVGTLLFNRSNLMLALRDAYAQLEISVPSSFRGEFIPPGEAFKGYAALVAIIQKASSDLLLVDPYVNVTLFTEIAPIVPEGVSLRCLTSNQSQTELRAGLAKWISTGEQSKRPVQVRLAPPKTLHDLHIVVDHRTIWNISQSFKDIAARSAASVTEDRTDLSTQKIEFWDASWDAASPIAAE